MLVVLGFIVALFGLAIVMALLMWFLTLLGVDEPVDSPVVGIVGISGFLGSWFGFCAGAPLGGLFFGVVVGLLVVAPVGLVWLIACSFDCPADRYPTTPPQFPNASNRASPPPSPPSAPVPSGRTPTPTPTASSFGVTMPQPDPEEEFLFRHLLTMLLRDHARAERLIQHAQSKYSSGSRKDWIRMVIEDLLRDNGESRAHVQVLLHEARAYASSVAGGA